MARTIPQRSYDRTIAIEAPYAKEYRTLLEAVAGDYDVEVSDAPRVGEGRYRRGTEATVTYRRRKEFDGVVVAYDIARDNAEAGLRHAVGFAPKGEDLATFKSSWLYGYSLAVTGAKLSREEVNAAVQPLIAGSGAWDGYRTAVDHGYRRSTPVAA